MNRLASCFCLVSSSPITAACSILQYAGVCLNTILFLFILVFTKINNDIQWMCSTILGLFFNVFDVVTALSKLNLKSGEEKLMVTKASKHTNKMQQFRLGKKRRGLNQPDKLFSVYDRNTKLHIEYRYFSHLLPKTFH